MVDVYNEFNNLTDKYQIQNFKSRKITKKYAFELADVADESEYLEIRYSVSTQYFKLQIKIKICIISFYL